MLQLVAMALVSSLVYRSLSPHFNFPGHSLIEDTESFVLDFPTFWVLPSVPYYFLRSGG